MFRTIVVGCDGSDRAADALALARQLRSPKGRLVLAAVHPHFGPLPDRTGAYNYSRYLAEDAWEGLAALAAGIPDSVPVERRVLAEDSVAAALDELAAAEQADLIVLGSTHVHRLGRLTGRTTVQRMLQGAPCAVAVAAPGQAERFGEHSRLCVAYDGSPESAAALQKAYEIAAGTGASVVMVRAVEPIMYASGYAPVPDDLDAEGKMRQQADATIEAAVAAAPAGVAVESRMVFGAAAKSILEVAHEGFDLLVAGSRHYGPLHRVLAGSVSTPLLVDGRVPVLVTTRGEGGRPTPGAPSPEEAAVS